MGFEFSIIVGSYYLLLVNTLQVEIILFIKCLKVTFITRTSKGGWVGIRCAFPSPPPPKKRLNFLDLLKE